MCTQMQMYHLFNLDVNFVPFFFIYICKRYVIFIKPMIGGVRGVMVIVVGNGHSDLSSNPGRD